jgi:hypothetical protein
MLAALERGAKRTYYLFRRGAKAAAAAMTSRGKARVNLQTGTTLLPEAINASGRPVVAPVTESLRSMIHSLQFSTDLF